LSSSRFRSGALVGCALLAVLVVGSTAAADDTTLPTLSIATSPQNPTPGSDVTITATVTPGTNPASTFLTVSCDTSWALNGSPSAPLDADATGLVFSRVVKVRSDAVPGERMGTCTVSDDEERSSFSPYSVTIASGTVENQPPTVATTGPYAVDEGGSVNVSANGLDPEGGALTYEWDLDGDGIYETPGQTVSFNAGDGPATGDIAVRVTDVGGLMATSTTMVTIANVDPTATLGAPTNADAGFAFALSLTSPHDPSTADTAAGLTYAFDCGTGVYSAFGSASTASCPTTDIGTRTVNAVIRDKDGGETTYTAEVHVTVTATSLCALAQELVSDPSVAVSLCDKLNAAAAAAARDNVGAKENQLRAFGNQVAAQTGKSISGSDADLLKRLSMRL
jgi:hypothetical protein